MIQEIDHVSKFNNKKHGVGCPSRCSISIMSKLGVSWFYNWNYFTNQQTSIQFVPMCFSGKQKRLATLPAHSQILLGFNEPDHQKQSNMSVDDAVKKWEVLVGKSSKIVSPATAGNPAAQHSWLQKFIFHENKPKIDCVAVHWYGGVDSSKFKKRMKQIYTKFNKPLWITQFACQTHSSSVQNPSKFTQKQVNDFLDQVIPWLQQQIWIERYAWHDSEVGTSSLWDQSGNLTQTGIKYASFCK